MTWSMEGIASRYSAAIVIAVTMIATSVIAKPHPGNVRIIDGDTLAIGTTHFRLYGIDAPETSQTCDLGGGTYQCGEAATRALAALVGSRRVECRPIDTDRYGRTVATCEAGGQDLGAAMVKAGEAVAYVRYSTRYLPEQQEAQAAGRGLWAGAFVMPWDWRKAH